MIEIPLTINNKKMLLRSCVTDSLKIDQYELCEWVTWTDRKTKIEKSEWRPFKWYSSIVGALDAVLRLKVAVSDAKTLAELKDIIRETRRELLSEFSTDLFPSIQEAL